MVNVAPVFKKGSKTSANNYRPVSLISQVVEILESLIRSRVMQYLEDNNIVTYCHQYHDQSLEQESNFHTSPKDL